VVTVLQVLSNFNSFILGFALSVVSAFLIDRRYYWQQVLLVVPYKLLRNLWSTSTRPVRLYPLFGFCYAKTKRALARRGQLEFAEGLLKRRAPTGPRTSA